MQTTDREVLSRKAARAKGGRKVDTLSTESAKSMSESVQCQKAKQAESAPGQWAWVDRATWTKRMLAALGNGVKGNKWFEGVRSLALKHPASGLATSHRAAYRALPRHQSLSRRVSRFCLTAAELDAQHALVRLGSKAIQSSLPISSRHGPFLADFFQCQQEQFEYSLIGWKRASGFADC